MSLLNQPHHDGSSAYVPAGHHSAGDVVPVAMRVPKAANVNGVWLRTMRDGEQRLVRARLKRPGQHQDVYVADLPVHNQPTHYRFLLDTPGRPGGYRWLNGTGIHASDVGDDADFRLTTAPPPPEWLTAGAVYQIFPDRFARSQAADARPTPEWATPLAWGADPAPLPPLTGRQLCGGDLGGIVEHLDHIQGLGATTVYMTPIFPGRTNHRYDASTFASVDPILGGDAALTRLTEAAHARGMRVMGDITTNHVGSAHDWFTTALADPLSPEHKMFLWAGRGNVPPTGQDIHPKYVPAYVSWLGHHHLPKLDWECPEVWARMIDDDDSAIAKWLKPPYNLDGWRIDVANMTGRYADVDNTLAVARGVRRRAIEVRPDAGVIAEHFFDYTRDLPGDGWHAGMNYSGFSRPVWGWLGDPGPDATHFGLPIGFNRITGGSMAATMRDWAARVPWQVAAAQWNILGSHDTPRVRTRLGSAANVELAATLLFTYLGTPMVFQGDEIGAGLGTSGEHARIAMPWDQAGGGPRWDNDVLASFTDLARLRRDEIALREGGLRWASADDDGVAFLRKTFDHRVLVVVARDDWSTTIPRWVLGPEPPELLYGGRLVATPSFDVNEDSITLTAPGPAVGIWRLA